MAVNGSSPSGCTLMNKCGSIDAFKIKDLHLMQISPNLAMTKDSMIDGQWKVKNIDNILIKQDFFYQCGIAYLPLRCDIY